MPGKLLLDEQKIAPNADQTNRFIATINGFFPSLIEDYLDDLKQAKKLDEVHLNRLVITLKKWANPLSEFTGVGLKEEVITEYFPNIKRVLANPLDLFSTDNTLTKADGQQIDKLVKIKLDALANELISTYQLTPPKPLALEDQKQADRWWKKRSDAEKEQIKQQYQQLSQQQKQQIQSFYQREYSYHYDHYVYSYYEPTFLDYYLWCHCHSYLDYCVIDGAVELTKLSLKLSATVIRAAATGIYEIGRGASNLAVNGASNCFGALDCVASSSKSAGKGDDGWKILLAIVAVIAMTSMAIAAIGSAIYTAKKVAKSFTNLVSGNKVFRSLTRLIGAAAGAYGGVMGGMLAGAALGSVIPGFGTVAGAIVGAICGTPIGAAIGVAIAKYTAKLISYWRHDGDTNPDKWNLSRKEAEQLRMQGYDSRKIQTAITALKKEKPKLNKKAVNTELQKIRKGVFPANTGSMQIGGLTYSLFPDAPAAHSSWGTPACAPSAPPLNSSLR